MCCETFKILKNALSGSFKQLPSVPNLRYSDNGGLAFTSDVFKKVFEHHIQLTEVVRRHEFELIKTVNELCSGEPSEETHRLIENLSRPIDCLTDTVPVRLFATNFDVEFFNHMCLTKKDVEIFHYYAEDTGRLKSILLMPKYIILKRFEQKDLISAVKLISSRALCQC